MVLVESFYPKEENLGLDCQYWDAELGCTFPKANLLGRVTCQGTKDEVCLYVKDGRQPVNIFTSWEMQEVKLRSPDGYTLPPDDRGPKPST